MPRNSVPSGFAAFWHLVHEGGLTIETCAGPPGQEVVVLRTLTQLDGDRTTCVFQDHLRGLSQAQRQDLAARHRQAVAGSVGKMISGLDRWERVARISLWALFAAGETAFAGLWGLHGFSVAEVATLVSGQAGCVVPVVGRFALPYAMPYVHKAYGWFLARQRRKVSAEVYARMQRGERIL